MARIDSFLFDRGHGNCSTKPEEGKDGEDYYDQSNKVDKLVHVPLLLLNWLECGCRGSSATPSAQFFHTSSSQEHNSEERALFQSGKERDSSIVRLADRLSQSEGAWRKPRGGSSCQRSIFASGPMAGALIGWPPVSNIDPWHGQSQQVSKLFQCR